MPDAPNPAPASTPAAVPTPAPTAMPAPSDPPSFRPITSQDELDRVLGERLGRERSKYADYDELKRKAGEFDKLDEASKTELQKANDRAAQLERDMTATKQALQDEQFRNAVISAAAGKSVIDPSAAVALLDRSKVEYDDAGSPKNVGPLLDELLKEKPYLVGNGRRPAPLPGGGAQTPSDGTSMDDWMRQRAKR